MRWQTGSAKAYGSWNRVTVGEVQLCSALFFQANIFWLVNDYEWSLPDGLKVSKHQKCIENLSWAEGLWQRLDLGKKRYFWWLMAVPPVESKTSFHLLRRCWTCPLVLVRNGVDWDWPNQFLGSLVSFLISRYTGRAMRNRSGEWW